MDREEGLLRDRIKLFVLYNPTTGSLTWRRRKLAEFSGGVRTLNSWNTRFYGKEIFSMSSDGYRTGMICRKSLKAHRIAWFLYYGEWPNGEIDHINGIRDDNRIVNLRDVSRSENMLNKRVHKNSKSGETGIRLTPYGKWQVRICKDGKSFCIGSFETKHDAIIARNAANTAFGFHQNHGRNFKLRPIDGVKVETKKEAF